MTTPIVALSISDQVERAGAIAGFAAVLGLAVLSLLYFASARELRRLREWADRAPERVADIEARLAEVSRQRAASPRPVGKPAVATGSQPATAAAVAKAGEGETSEEPTAATDADQAVPAAPPPAGAEADEAKPAEAAQSDGDGADTDDPADESSDRPGIVGPQPVPAGVLDGAAAPDLTEIRRPPQMPARPPVAGDQTLVGAAGRELRQNRPSARPRPQTQIRPSTARLMESARTSNAQRRAQGPPIPPPVAARRSGRHDRGRIALIVAGALAVVAIGVFVATTVLGGGDGEPTAPSTIATTPPPSGGGGSQVDRASTEVSVLNGTTIVGLAADLANRLADAGFRRGDVTNAPDQFRSATIIEYRRGQRAAALEVADLIPGAGADAVRLMEAGTSVREPDADIVVTVGSDQTPTGTS